MTVCVTGVLGINTPPETRVATVRTCVPHMVRSEVICNVWGCRDVKYLYCTIPIPTDSCPGSRRSLIKIACN